jgi:hypothetical protein
LSSHEKEQRKPSYLGTTNHLQVEPLLWHLGVECYVEILGNQQTDRLVRDIFPPHFFTENKGAIEDFWKPGTASLAVAQRYGFPPEMVKPSEEA